MKLNLNGYNQTVWIDSGSHRLIFLPHTRRERESPLHKFSHAFGRFTRMYPITFQGAGVVAYAG